MSQIQLLEPFVNGGIRNANFLNGAVLTAEDLRAAQDANWQEHDQLGMAAGAGVAWGLEAAISNASTVVQPLVHVTRGLALNRNGEAVALNTDLELLLVKAADPLPANAGAFAQCAPPGTGTTLTNLGIYILTVLPATSFQEQRPVTDLSSQGVGTACGSRYIVEGVKFKLLSLDTSALKNPTPLRQRTAQLATQLDGDLELLARTSGPAAATLQAQVTRNLNKLRNGVAHLCLGTDLMPAFAADAFTRDFNGNSPFISYGPLDDLFASQSLTPCEVPLAIVYWTIGGLQFVDRWAVRRRLSPQSLSRLWPLPWSPRRLAESEAAFLQFQEQMEQMLRTSTQAVTAATQATDNFQYLPACGFLPVIGNGSSAGFDPALFFGSLSAGGPTTIQGAKLAKLLYDSWLHRPVDLSAPALLQLYQVKENVDAIAAGQSSQLYYLFASREMQNIAENDAVAGSFHDAWDVYRGLVKRRVFLPNEATSDAIGARIMILAAIQDVMSVAQRNLSLAEGGSLDYQNVLGAFQDLYQVQRELVILFQSQIPGIAFPFDEDRLFFAESFSILLDKSPASLNAALQKKDAAAAVAAQGAINNMVGSWTGEGAAIGFLQVQYFGSTRGTVQVPSDPLPYPHTFQVTNRTDKTLTIDLHASIVAQHGGWDGSAQFSNDKGSNITSVTLVSGGTQAVNAMVTTPSTAQIGDTPILTVTVSVGPPHNLQQSASLGLRVQAVAGPPVLQTVVFTHTQQPPNASNVPLAQNLQFDLDLRYATQIAPFNADFTFTVTVTASGPTTADEWPGDIVNRAVTNPSPNVYQTVVNLVNGAALDTRVTFAIRTPPAKGAADKIANVAVHVEATIGGNKVSADAGPFTLTLIH
jgi:hypothetical protein